MLRGLLATVPWLVVGGLVSLVVGASRAPEIMTVGYEVRFEDLWLPVAVGGLVLALAAAALLPLRWALAAPTAVREPARRRRGPLALLLIAVALGAVSWAAHAEAWRRADEAQAAFVASLTEQAPPSRGPVVFHEDWRVTARWSLALHLASVAAFLAAPAWCAGRARRRGAAA